MTWDPGARRSGAGVKAQGGCELGHGMWRFLEQGKMRQPMEEEGDSAKIGRMLWAYARCAVLPLEAQAG